MEAGLFCTWAITVLLFSFGEKQHGGPAARSLIHTNWCVHAWNHTKITKSHIGHKTRCCFFQFHKCFLVLYIEHIVHGVKPTLYCGTLIIYNISIYADVYHEASGWHLGPFRWLFIREVAFHLHGNQMRLRRYNQEGGWCPNRNELCLSENRCRWQACRKQPRTMEQRHAENPMCC